ncbi:hypothetical protein D9M70_345200 [compost metagenome]
MPVDSTKMITTTRHMDSTEASSNFGMPKCRGSTTWNQGVSSRPFRSTMPHAPARA